MLYKQQLKNISFEDAMEKAMEECSFITTQYLLEEFAIQNIKEGRIYLAIHILNAIKNADGSEDSYFNYDYYMGTSEIPTPIETMDDLFDLDIFED